MRLVNVDFGRIASIRLFVFLFIFPKKSVINLNIGILVMVFFLGIPAKKVQSCDLTELALDSLVQVGNEWDIYVTLRIGAGVTGSTVQANNSTTNMIFAFWSCKDTIAIPYFTPSITSDSTGVTLDGYYIEQSFLGSSGNVLYQIDSINPGFFTCINSTLLCGRIHTQESQLRFRTEVLPDSIRCYGAEGVGNPIGGCYPNPDMLIDFSAISFGCPSDTVPPVITCPANQTATACSPLPDYTLLASVSDDTDSFPTVTQSPGPGTSINPGQVNVTLTATDSSGNSASCSFLVNLVDAIPPAAICSGTTLQLDGIGNAILDPISLLGGSIDDCGIESYFVLDTVFDCSDIGSMFLPFVLTDSSGNSTMGSCLVSIQDTNSPQANCQNITLAIGPAGAVGVPVASIAGQSSDNCGPPILTSSIDSLYCADVGNSVPVTVLVTDSSGNNSTCISNITVIDTIDPVITCVSVTLPNDPGSCGAVWNGGNVVATDNCSNPVTVGSNPTQGSFLPIGVTPITYTATDGSGNQISVTCLATVNDVEPPVVTCQPITIYLGSSGVDTVFTSDVGTATDNCGVTSVMGSEFELDCGNVPQVNYSFTASDSSGNMDSCQAMVAVLDTLAPTITCPGSQNLPSQSGICGAVATWNPPGTSDNCSISNVSSSSTSGSIFPPGTTPVTYTSTDINGNQSICSFTISVTGQPLQVTVEPDTLFNGNHIACFGDTSGSAEAIVSGGCPPYQFLWSNGGTGSMVTGLPSGWNYVTVTDSGGNVMVDSVFLVEPAPLVATIPAHGPLCGNDSVGFQVQVSGGNTNRMFCIRISSSPVETCYQENTPGNFQIGPIGPGLYHWRVEDTLGCMIADSFVVDSFPFTVVDLGSDTMVCVGESISLDAGNPGGQYLWSTGDTSQMIQTFQTGLIEVEVIDTNGCIGSDSILVSNHPPPMAQASSNSPLCANDSLYLTAAGNFPLYQWSGPGFQSSQQNDTIFPQIVIGVIAYILLIEDANGCEDRDTVSVTVNPNPSVNLGPDTLLCPAQSLVLNAGPASGYSWSTGAQSQQILINMPGIYEVTVTDNNGCEGTDDIEITAGAQPTVSFTINPSGNQTFDFMDLSTGFVNTWEWIFGDGNGSSLQNPTHTYAGSGSYTVCLTVRGECADSICQVLMVVSVPEPEVDGEVSLFPNPNQGRFMLQFEKASWEEKRVEVYDGGGKIVWSSIVEAGRKELELDLTSLAEGIYHIWIQGPGGHISVLNLVLQR